MMKVTFKSANHCNTLCFWLYIENPRRPSALAPSAAMNRSVVEKVMFITNFDNVDHIVVYGRNIIIKNIS